VQEAASIKRKQSSSKTHGQILLLKIMSFFYSRRSSDGFDAKVPSSSKVEPSEFMPKLPHDKNSASNPISIVCIYILCMDPVKPETL
jgi:hypothetical protein